MSLGNLFVLQKRPKDVDLVSGLLNRDHPFSIPKYVRDSRRVDICFDIRDFSRHRV